MTLQKKSKQSLEQWIREVRYAEYKLKELNEKLEYWNSQLFAYHSPSFEPRISNTPTYRTSNRIDYILEKIDEYDHLISVENTKIISYKAFLDKLDLKTRDCVHMYIYEKNKVVDILNCIKISRTQLYKLIYTSKIIFNKIKK